MDNFNNTNISEFEDLQSQEENPLIIQNLLYSNNNETHFFCKKCLQPFSDDDDDDSTSSADSSSDDEDSVSPIFREDPADIEERILEEIDDYVTNNPLRISRPNIESEIAAEISTVLFDEWLDEDLCEEDDLPEIREWTQKMVTTYFECATVVPPRQGGEAAVMTPLRRASIARKMHILNNIQSPAQRTEEWYDSRYNLITASNLWKVLGTEAQQNQLIMEKCQPFDQFKEDCARQTSGTAMFSDNPMAWGQKYEPVTALLYQSKNRTTIGEYGCIIHPEWPFLGASPDGINTDPDSPLYGRMLEIKNIVNREIDGVPSTAYWTQTQIQMEVCDLDECDFVETRFKEYASKQEFEESANPCKGVILTFVPRITIEQTMSRRIEKMPPIREYWISDDASPLENTNIQIENLIQTKRQQHADYVLSQCDYWGLDQYSCVLIKRNRAWFEAAIPQIESIWRTIERERVTGCEHRAPKKRAPKTQEIPQITVTKLCIFQGTGEMEDGDV
jgi:putative phage-type endonuclease